MLFLVKRHGLASLGLLGLLVVVGLGLRSLSSSAPPFGWSVRNALLGGAVFLVVLCSDGLLHGMFLVLFGDRYRRRHQELAEVFRGQSLAALGAGALLAGVGEEMVFRGVSLAPAYLFPAAVIFGLLHHIRGRLWPFTVWAIYQGVLFAIALLLLGDLMVTMVAHFLHDAAGFLLFRWLRSRET